MIMNAADRVKIIFRKKTSGFIIHADFESILMPENNGSQNLEDSHTNNYQKHIAFSYRYKLVLMIRLVSLLRHT